MIIGTLQKSAMMEKIRRFILTASALGEIRINWLCNSEHTSEKTHGEQLYLQIRRGLTWQRSTEGEKWNLKALWILMLEFFMEDKLM